MTIGFVPTISASMVVVAAERELAEAQGVTLDTTPVAGAGSTNQVAALLSGDLDVIVSGTNTIIDAVAEDADLQIIGSVAPLLYSIVLNKDVADDLGVDASASPDEKLRALEGLKIAASPPGSTGNTVLRTLLDDAGLDPDKDVQIVPLTDAGAIPAGISRGSFDGSFFALGSGEVNVADGSGVLWLSIPLGDVPILDDYIGVVIVASKRFLEDEPDTAESVFKAIQAAHDLIENDPDAAAATVQDSVFAEADPAVFDSVWEQVSRAYPEPAYTEAQWDTFVELFDEASDKDYAAIDYEDLVAEFARG